MGYLKRMREQVLKKKIVTEQSDNCHTMQPSMMMMRNLYIYMKNNKNN